MPFVSKATWVARAKDAAKVMAGMTIAELGLCAKEIAQVAVKESVFPFIKLRGSEITLGHEMQRTGEMLNTIGNASGYVSIV